MGINDFGTGALLWGLLSIPVLIGIALLAAWLADRIQDGPKRGRRKKEKVEVNDQ